LAHAFIDGKQSAEQEHHKSDNERPEIGLHAMAERMSRIRRTLAALLPDEKQNLVAGIHQRMNRFGVHGDRSGNPGGNKFRDRDGEIARERHQDDQCRAFGHGCSFAWPPRYRFGSPKRQIPSIGSKALSTEHGSG
jgi:hypothetical protein